MDASRPVAGSTTHMKALRTTRTLTRPAAQDLSLSLFDYPSLRVKTLDACEPSTDGDRTDDTAPSSVRLRLNLDGTVPLSALSTGSIYSQASWNDEGIISPINAVRTDRRRFAIALQSPDLDDLWPLAFSPSSASIGNFIVGLRNAGELLSPSLGFVTEATLSPVTPPEPDAASVAVEAAANSVVAEKEAKALLTIWSEPVHELVLDTTATPSLSEATPTGQNVPNIFTSEKPEANVGQDGASSAKRLRRILSHISLPVFPSKTSQRTKRHASVEVKARYTAERRPKILCKSFAWKHSSMLKSIIDNDCFEPPLPAINISPLAFNFECTEDGDSENGSDLNTPGTHDPEGDWDLIGIAVV